MIRRSSIALCVVLLAACTSSGASPHTNRSGSSGGQLGHGSRPLRFTLTALHLPAARERSVAGVIGGTIYVAGGLDPSDVSQSSVFALDPATGRATEAGTVPQAFHDGAGAVIGGRLVVFGGGAVQGTNVVQTFDPRSGGGAVIGHLPKALSDVSSATVGGTTYVVGGYDGVTAQAAIYSTNDGHTFRRAGLLPLGLRYTAVAAIDHSVFVAGGDAQNGSPVSSVYRLDTRSGSVRQVAHLGTALGHAAAFVLGGRLVVAGGRDAGGHALASVWVVDPATGHVRRALPLPAPVADAAVAVTSKGAWLAGGWRNGTWLTQVVLARG